MSKEILRIEKAHKIFTGQGMRGKNHSVVALKDINLSFFEGETIGLVGESGSGKTTLGRSLIGLERLTSGSVFFENKDVSMLSKNERKKLASSLQIIFQDPYSALNPRMSALELVMEPLLLFETKEVAKEKAIQILNEVGIVDEAIYKLPKNFSGGQRQRIGIARAVATSPKFILCDEPTSALDVSIQSQILALLKKIQKEHQLSYLFITHDLSVVKYIADKIVVMYRGQIVEMGKTDQIFNNAQHDYTKRLLNSAPIADPILAKKAYEQSDSVLEDIYIDETAQLVEVEENHFVRK